ncbi:GntR family transcriptional regulator [Acidiferrobacter sp.]|jgi:DNA-binding GntR family transcriptional regulator|uniref:GntR family transcriptional regulator n=1 Tax=Acidiferrobacter sp. TaxID=1872107 RepID=UPI0026045131|nr:GntR family transcriptional regulator [Acidiferrobacter sp.]
MDGLAQRVSASTIYESLKEMILSFEIYPGSRITESDLAAHFKVSRTPVREALQRLAQEGQVSIRTKQGCFVRQISISELAQFYRVRTALECLSLEIAARSMAKEALRTLAQEWDPAHCSSAATDLSLMVQKEESFHMALARGGGNQALATYLNDINERIRVIRRLDFTAGFRIERTYEEHHRIACLLLEGDLTAAKMLMADHILQSEKFARSVTLEQLARTETGAARSAMR